MNEIRDLTLLANAQRVLIEARTIDEAKDLRDKAVAVRAYVQKARLGRTLMIEAATIRIRAERRLGQMLRETPLANSAPGNQYTHSTASNGNDTASLRELGITKNESSRSQRIANLADELFEKYLADCQQAQREPTIAAVLRLAPKNNGDNQDASKDTHRATAMSTIRATDGVSAAATVLLVLPTVDSEDPDLYQARIIDRLCRSTPGDTFHPDAHLYLWTNGPQLPDALDIMEAWAFTYFGSMAYVYRQTRPDVPWHDAHHLLLLGTRGNQPIEEAVPRSWLECPRPDEGHVPREVIDTIRTASPAPYLWLLGDPLGAPDDWTAIHAPSQLGLGS